MEHVGLKVVYYALGGGHGHAMRGLAILRRWRAKRPRDRVSLLAPARLGPWARHEAVACASPPAGNPDRATLARWLGDRFADSAPDLLLVDVFPRGILGELSDVWPRGAQAWLVSRWCRPAYYLTAPIRAFLERHYHGLVWGERPPKQLEALAIRQERVDPVLIRHRKECLARHSARKALGIGGRERLVMAVGTGSSVGQEHLWRLLLGVCRRVEERIRAPIVLRFVSDALLAERRGRARKISLFPAMRYLRAADAVVCAGGYHAFHETRCLGTPTLFLPQHRIYDDQYLRVGSAGLVRSPADLEIRMERLLTQPAVTRSPRGCDGARQVVNLVAGEL